MVGNPYDKEGEDWLGTFRRIGLGIENKKSTFYLTAKVLSLGNAQINLAFLSLIRTFGFAQGTFARK